MGIISRSNGMTRYKREPGTPITPQERKELEALARMPDSEIDTSDAPPLPESAWKNAIRGGLHRRPKQEVTLLLDGDIIDWLKKDGDNYETRANQILRERMLNDMFAR
jgi:uncharacterized protein (DUF4415 family)